MKIIVTGASGFIARALIADISQNDNDEVFAIVRNKNTIPFSRSVKALALDLADPGSYHYLPQGADAVVHLVQANVPFPECATELFMTNSLSTQLLLDYSGRAGVSRFIFASSGDVYGQRETVCEENDPCKVTSFYTATKLASEHLVEAYSDHLSGLILRFFHPYGIGQRDRLIPKLVESIRHGLPIRIGVKGSPFVSPIFISDVTLVLKRALAMTQAMLRSMPKIVNISGDEVVSIQDLALSLAHCLQMAPVFLECHESKGVMAGKNARMKELFGPLRLVPLKEGLSKITQA